MTDHRPHTSFYVTARARMASLHGVPVTVLRKGDPTVGAIVLKINLLDGTARVLTEGREQDKKMWMSITDQDPLPEREADIIMTRQAEYDPDIWLVEIEDRQGRIWF